MTRKKLKKVSSDKSQLEKDSISNLTNPRPRTSMTQIHKEMLMTKVKSENMQVNASIYKMHSFLKQCFARSLIDKIWWY